MMVKYITPAKCTPSRFEQGKRLLDFCIPRIKKVNCVSIRGEAEDGTTSGVDFYNIVKDGEHDLTVTVEQKELVARGLVAERSPLAHITIDFWAEAK